MIQRCDSTCSWCAREFFTWWRRRVNSMRGRDGKGDFNAAAATSVKPEQGRDGEVKR